MFLKEAWFLGVRVGFGGREGALASALIVGRFIISKYHCFIVIIGVSVAPSAS